LSKQKPVVNPNGKPVPEDWLELYEARKQECLINNWQTHFTVPHKPSITDFAKSEREARNEYIKVN
jgi:hypothetical protein